MKQLRNAHALNNFIPYFLISFLVCLVSVLSRIYFNGLVYGFDYGVFQPDGFYYSYQTLTYMGKDHFWAASEVSNWYEHYSAKPWDTSLAQTLPENSPLWGLVAPRILYPLLSVPFVALFGLAGMLAIPIISFFILIFCTQYLSNKISMPLLGVVLNYLILSSPTILRWMTSNITDSLLCGLFSLATIVIWKISHKNSFKRYISLVAIIVLTGLTRFSLPIWLAISLVFFLNKNRGASLITLLSSTLVAIPTLFMGPKIAFLPELGESPVLSKVILLPIKLFTIPSVELLQLAALDRVLLALIIASLFISVKNFKLIISQFYIATLIAVLGIGVMNGTLGVNFRYQLPLIPFSIWIIINWVGKFKVVRSLNV